MSAQREKWIAVDVDGVLADQITQLLPTLSEVSGRKVIYEDITEWNPQLGRVSLADLIASKQMDRGYILSMRPINGAIDAITRLHARFNIAIVTSRPECTVRWTKEWLERHSCPFDTFLSSNDGEKHKTDLKAHALIDDHLVNVEAFLEETEGVAVLFSQPWNQHSSHLAQYVRSNRLKLLCSWSEIQGFIEASL